MTIRIVQQLKSGNDTRQEMTRNIKDFRLRHDFQSCRKERFKSEKK